MVINETRLTFLSTDSTSFYSNEENDLFKVNGDMNENGFSKSLYFLSPQSFFLKYLF